MAELEVLHPGVPHLRYSIRFGMLSHFLDRRLLGQQDDSIGHSSREPNPLAVLLVDQIQVILVGAQRIVRVRLERTGFLFPQRLNGDHIELGTVYVNGIFDVDRLAALQTQVDVAHHFEARNLEMVRGEEST